MTLCVAAQDNSSVMLPNGWRLTPAGTHIELGDLPLNMAVSPNQHWLAVTNNGYGRQSVDVIDLRTDTKVCSKTIKQSWYGLCFSHDSRRLYASAGNANMVMIYDLGHDGNLTLCDSIVMGEPWPNRISPSGIALHPKKQQLYVVTRWDNSLYVYDLKTKSRLLKVPLGGKAYQVVLSRDGRWAYISCWSEGQLLVWDTERRSVASRIKVGSHPNELCLDEKRHRIFVANADDNTVSVVNLSNGHVEETMNTAVTLGKLSGSTTNGLCLLNSGKWLAVANADNNCLTIFDVSKPRQSRGLGFIPTGWYPTNVKSVRGKLYVTDGKGLRSLPNPEGPNPVQRTQAYGHHQGDAKRAKNVQYIAGLFLGSLSIIPHPSEQQLMDYSRQVASNTPSLTDSLFERQRPAGNPIPSPEEAGKVKSPIRYVFYIIKENRTYDQVLGDLPQGNGDSSLVLFGPDVTPNQHKLASDFVLLDNFFVNAEVSCDGHNWSMGAYANDYLEKTWPTYYSRRGDAYSGEGLQPMGNNKSGFLWDNCKRHNVSYRSYGEFAYKGKDGIMRASVDGLKGHVCHTYPGFSLSIADTTRYRLWQADFDSLLAMGQVPQLSIVRLGNDHTEGMRVGRPTPQAHVADNDLAVGMFVEHLSHSPIWGQTAVFILEDDAQNGPDHVDAHRSTTYVAGGLVKRGFVDHTPYTTTSVIKTMELILGLPPMTQYDAMARSMWQCFDANANLTPWSHQSSLVNLKEVIQPDSSIAHLQRLSESYDFTKEDAVPDVEFNQVLWHGIKGPKVQYPAIRRSAFLSYTADDDDDDD